MAGSILDLTDDQRIASLLEAARLLIHEATILAEQNEEISVEQHGALSAAYLIVTFLMYTRREDGNRWWFADQVLRAGVDALVKSTDEGMAEAKAEAARNARRNAQNN